MAMISDDTASVLREAIHECTRRIRGAVAELDRVLPVSQHEVMKRGIPYDFKEHPEVKPLRITSGRTLNYDIDSLNQTLDQLMEDLKEQEDACYEELHSWLDKGGIKEFYVLSPFQVWVTQDNFNLQFITAGCFAAK